MLHRMSCSRIGRVGRILGREPTAIRIRRRGKKNRVGSKGRMSEGTWPSIERIVHRQTFGGIELVSKDRCVEESRLWRLMLMS